MEKPIIVLLLAGLLLTGCVKNKESSSEEISESEVASESVDWNKIENRLKSIPRFKNIRKTSSYDEIFTRVFLIDFEQYIDHEHHELGTFTQRIEFGYHSKISSFSVCI